MEVMWKWRSCGDAGHVEMEIMCENGEVHGVKISHYNWTFPSKLLNVVEYSTLHWYRTFFMVDVFFLHLKMSENTLLMSTSIHIPTLTHTNARVRFWTSTIVILCMWSNLNLIMPQWTWQEWWCWLLLVRQIIASALSAHQSIVWHKSPGQTPVAKEVNSLAGRENKRKRWKIRLVCHWAH